MTARRFVLDGSVALKWFLPESMGSARYANDILAARNQTPKPAKDGRGSDDEGLKLDFLFNNVAPSPAASNPSTPPPELRQTPMDGTSRRQPEPPPPVISQPSTEFRLPPGGKPVILIGAGTGIAPFVGMIEGNRQRRPLHLFWGGRDPGSDFLYEASLKTCLADRRLATLETAFSRVEDRAYVQDRLHQSAPKLAAMLSKGASVMVCGGDEMASAVRAEFESILKTIDLSVVRLKSKGLYLEDVY